MGSSALVRAHPAPFVLPSLLSALVGQVVSWLWSPVIFNPNGVEWLDVIKDFDGWLQWMSANDADPEKSWKSWCTQQNLVSAQPGAHMLKLQALLESLALTN